MSALVEKLFGNGQLTEEAQGELRTILLQMRNERNAFERSASEAQASLEQASGPAEAVAQSIAKLEERLHAVEQLAANAVSLEATQREVSSRIDQAASQAESIEAALDPIRSDLEQTKHLLQDTTVLRSDLEPLLDLGKELQTLKSDVLALRGELSDTQQHMASVRQQHDGVEQRSAAATERLASLEGQYGEMTVGLHAATQQLAQLQGTMQSVSTLAGQVPDLRRELDTLRALRDHVAQKVSELQQQRETVDYATSQGMRLAELVQRIDRDLEAQQEKAKALVKLEQDATRLSATHDELRRQLDHLAERQREDGQVEEARRQEFQALQEQMDGRIRDTISRFDFEQGRLETASVQISDLRQSLAEVERRLDTVQETQEGVAALRKELGQLGDRVVSMAIDLAPLDSYAERMVTVKGDIARAEQSVKEIGRRADELSGTIANTDGQLTELQELSERTERQTRDLTQLREYLGHLEQRVAKWEAAEATVSRAIDDATRRQATVDALRADLQRMLQVAKETTDAVRVISESHDEVSDARRLIDVVLTEIQAVKDESAQLESRRKDLTDVDRQIARAEALLIDIRTSLEMLNGQKAFLEDVMDTAGSLRFQSKQAEALIATLRDARQRLASGNG
jgi:chromosome segregation ATPase